MALKIVVDGYNLLNCSSEWQRLANTDLKLAREHMLCSLRKYQKEKKHPILVVFDGEKNGWPTQTSDRSYNIDIIYSRLGEKADEVIKRIAYKLRQAAIVITSDRELGNTVASYGAEVIPAGSFEAKLRFIEQLDTGKYDIDEYGDENINKKHYTKKKGPAYRRSKRDRRRHARLKKL